MLTRESSRRVHNRPHARFWFLVYDDVGKFVDGKVLRVQHICSSVPVAHLSGRTDALEG